MRQHLYDVIFEKLCKMKTSIFWLDTSPCLSTKHESEESGLVQGERSTPGYMSPSIGPSVKTESKKLDVHQIYYYMIFEWYF